MQEIIDYANWLDVASNCGVAGKFNIPVRCAKLCEEICELKKVPQFSKCAFEDELGDVISTTALLANALEIKYFPSVAEQSNFLDVVCNLLKNVIVPALMGIPYEKEVAEKAVYSMVIELNHFRGTFDTKKMISEKKAEFLIANNC